MIKTAALITRARGLTREAFERYYEERHVPLSLRHFHRWRGYERNHVHEVLAGALPDFDCVSEFWYPDEQELRRVVDFIASEAGQAVREDELAFMDKGRNAFFEVAEEVLIGDPRRFVGEREEVNADATAPKVIVFVPGRAGAGNGSAGETAGDERASAADPISALRERVLSLASSPACAIERVIVHRVEVGDASDSSPPCHGFVSLWFADAEGLRVAVESLEAELREQLGAEAGWSIFQVREVRSHCGD